MGHEKCVASECQTSRRQVLRTLGALGVGTVLTPSLLRSATRQMTGSAEEIPSRVDVHFHVVSPAYLKRTARFVDPNRGNARSDTTLTRWTPALAVGEMDKGGIAKGMLSIAVGVVTFGNDDATRKMSAPSDGDRAPNGVRAEVKKLYFDVSNASYPSALDALADVVPVSQMLFGSDYPFAKVATTVDGLKQFSKFSKSDLQAISRGNAMQLFPRIRG
jgi:6-methylsalicylate decarboxylase